MRKNLNLELRLFPPSVSDLRPTTEEEAEASESAQQDHYQHQQDHHQSLTIFYDGKICSRDVTEIQARSILMLANKEMEEKVRTPTGSESSSPAALLSPHYNNNLYSPGTAFSMKKSLQRFLQKRKNRVQEASPYHK